MRVRAAVRAAAAPFVASVSLRVPTECGAEAVAEPFWNRHAAINSIHIIFVIVLATLLSCLWAAAAPQQRPQRLWVDADGSVEIIVRGHTAIPLMLLVVVAVVQRALSRGVAGSVHAVTSHTLRVSALARPITKALRVSAKEAAKRSRLHRYAAAAASGDVLMVAMVMIVAELLLLLLGSRCCGRVTAAGW